MINRNFPIPKKGKHYKEKRQTSNNISTFGDIYGFWR